MPLLLRLNHPLFIAFMLGALLPLGFAPVHWTWLIALSLVGLLTLLHQQAQAKPWTIGWMYGLGMFGIGVSWIYVSIHFYGHNPTWLAVLITSVFVAFMAQFVGLTTWLMQRFSPLSPTLPSIAGFAGLWTLLEWSRSWLLTGFPWLQLGYSQTSTWLGLAAPYIGSYGISFLVLLTSGLIWLLYHDRKHPKRLLAPAFLLASLLSLLFISSQWSWTQASHRPLRVALVQGNIPQDDKWHPSYAYSILHTYQTLSEPHWGVDLIIWPESAIPIPFDQLPLTILNDLQRQVHSHDTALLTGIPTRAAHGYYNSMMLITPDIHFFHKTHLVPFGEFIPLKRYLQPWIESMAIPMTDFLSNAIAQPNLSIKALNIAPFICYEIAYSQTVRQRSQDSHSLLTISNDAWFGRSLAPGQHLQIGQMRAMETARYHLFSTNDGITAIIAPKGAIQAQVPQGETITLVGTIEPRQGKTPWQRLGDAPILGLAMLGWLWAIYEQRSKLKKISA